MNQAVAEKVPFEDTVKNMLPGQVLVRRIGKAGKRSEIIQTLDHDKDTDAPFLAEVIKLGPGKRHKFSGKEVPMNISIGDTIVHSCYDGRVVGPREENLFVLDQEVIWGVVEDEE